jgi:putative PEP-CTERM system TPR-repeat lipoprotein
MGQTEVALAEVRELLGKAAKDPNILALAGEAYLASGDVTNAAQYYERARTLVPENVRVQTRLAQIRFAAGDADKGFAELEAAASRSDDYQADLALITTHLRQRQADKALTAIQKLENKQPQNPLTHNLRGVALLLKNDYVKARGSFERAVELSPTYMPAVANLARLDLREKKPEAAKKRYEAVLKKEPQNEQALLGLAVLLRVTGAPLEEIEKALRRSIAANPTSPNARGALVNFYLRTRDVKAALAAAQEGAAALPNVPGMIEALGVAQLSAGDNRQAISTLMRLTEMQPKSHQAQLLLATAHVQAKQPDDAIRALRAALVLRPDLAGAQRDIAAIYVATGRADQAIKEARSVQADNPKQPFGYLLEGEIYVAQKKFDDAERVYRAALKKFDLPALAARVHSVMDAGGKPQEAQTLAEQWIAAHPKDAFLLNYLAERDLAAKRYESAAKRYQAALRRAPENALLLNNLAWVANELKQPDALEYAERAHDLAPDNPSIMDTLGGILMATGDTDRALDMFGRAAEIAPQAYNIRLNFAKALIKANRKEPARKELEALAKLDSRNPIQQEAAKLLQTL